MKKRLLTLILAAACLIGCGGRSIPDAAGNNLSSEQEYHTTEELLYAEGFTIEHFKGAELLTVMESGERLLVLDEGEDILPGIPDDCIILKKPLKNIYLVASNTFDYFDALGSIDSIGFSGQKPEGWHIDSAKSAMERGDIVYAGKYSAPDYELILENGCDLTIENTMIYHAPEVKEKLESFGIPVIVDRSSYESHPLGRVEWVKFYGALTGKLDRAEEIFESQVSTLEQIETKDTGRTAAFFYVTENGLVQVRKAGDYIPKLMELAGGNYIFSDTFDDSDAKTSVNMQQEEFYAGAKDADILVYNNNIGSSVISLDDILEKFPLLSDFKAVKEGSVWCAGGDLYQRPMRLATLAHDFSVIFSGSEEETEYLYRL